MTRDEMLREADQLETEAKSNEVYARKMEETTARTDGRLGHIANPTNYAVHLKAAADKRARAAHLRADAAFGEELVELRDKAGLTQSALSAKSGVSTNEIWLIETGKVRPHSATKAAIVAALKTAR